MVPIRRAADLTAARLCPSGPAGPTIRPTLLGDRNMLKKFAAAAVVAVATLFVGGSQAQAQDGPIADAYLSYGFDYAAAAYTDSGTADGYDAYLYSYYAQYFASVGEFYNAALCGMYAADYALADYDATGNGNAYEAYQLLSAGAEYANYAYLGF